MTKSAQLSKELSNLANRLSEASAWNGTLEPVNMVTDDFLYELQCYFRLALDVSSSFGVVIAGNVKKQSSGQLLAHWPRKPGKKVNFSFLSLTKPHGAEQFQLCPGIRVRDRDGKDRAPDLNLLRANAPADPTFGDLLSCWDAKYTIKFGPLSDVAVSDFVFTVAQLGTPQPPVSWTRTTPKMWGRPGLLTNGAASTEPAAMLLRVGIAETAYFPEAPATRP